MKYKRNRIGLVITGIYTWLMIILFGGMVCETFILYPNVFHDIPASLKRAKEFAVVAGPGTFFPQLGAAVMIVGLISVLFNWNVQPVRFRTLTSLSLIFFGDFLFSMFFFWPKNKIMFGPGSELHTAIYLQNIAKQFQAGQWLRISISGLGAAISFDSFLKNYTVFESAFKKEHLIITVDKVHDTSATHQLSEAENINQVK